MAVPTPTFGGSLMSPWGADSCNPKGSPKYEPFTDIFEQEYVARQKLIDQQIRAQMVQAAKSRHFGEVTVQVLKENGLFRASKQELAALWRARFGDAWVVPSTTDETDKFFIIAAKRAGLRLDLWTVRDETTWQNVECVRLVDDTNS